jgi:hypothetical protein
MESTPTTYNAVALAATLGSPPSQLLTRENTLIWKALVIPALRGARVLDLVQGIEKSPEEHIEVEAFDKKRSIKVENLDYTAWISRDLHVLRWLLNALSPDVLVHIIGLKTSTEVWAAIDVHISAKSKTRVQLLHSALNDTSKGDLSADKYFAKMKSLASKLAAAGKPLDDDELLYYILHGLGSHYNNLHTAVNANPGTALSDLLGQVQAFDKQHKMEDPSFISSANVARRDSRPRQDDRRPRLDDRPRQDYRQDRPCYDDHGRQDLRQDYRQDRDRPRYEDRPWYDDRGRQDYRGRRFDGGYQGHHRDDDRPRCYDDDRHRHDDGVHHRDR